MLRASFSNAEYQSCRQQDAGEFIKWLLNELTEKCAMSTCSTLFADYTGKKPKRKKKHRKKDREQPDLARKLQAEAEAKGETYDGSSNKRQKTEGTYDGSVFQHQVYICL